MKREEAIANLNHLYGMVAPDIQRSLDVAIKALENSTGDLISRELLKKDIEAQISDFNELNKKGEPYKDFKDIRAILFGLVIGKNLIDNAQPVEPDRPQGEWYYGEDECGQDGWFCSECNFFVPWYYQYYEKDINFIREYKACPHCLAEMITYTGKDRDTEGGAKE